MVVSLTVDVPEAGEQPPAKLEIKVLDVIAVPGPKNQEVYIGELVKFTNETKGPEGLTWKWNFWDDSSASTNKAPTHIYKKMPSKMLVNLTVNVPNVGDHGAKELPINVKMVSAVIAADSLTVYVGDEVHFRNETEGPENMVWVWNFGDDKPVGPENSKKEATHTYDENGTYEVTLTVHFKDSDGQIILGIEPVTTTLTITVLPNDFQPTITKIEAGLPKTVGGKLILPVTVDVNGTGKEVKLKYNGKEDKQPFDRKKKRYTFNVDIEDQKPKASLLKKGVKKELEVEATVTPSGSGHTDANKAKELHFTVTTKRSGLFWILLAIILLLVGAAVGFIFWRGKQPRVEGQLRDLNGSGRVDLFDYDQKRDLEIDLIDVSSSLAGKKMKFIFRGSRSDPDIQMTVLTSNFEANGKPYTLGELCEVTTTVIITIGDDKIQYKP
jgi:plastocyanin